MQASGGPRAGVALTIGAFDGIHRGHQDLIMQMVDGAQQAGLDPVCITFEPDPEVVVRPEREHRSLSTAAERRAQILALGPLRIDVVPFTLEVAKQTPEEFVDWLRSSYELRMLWVGPDFALGHNRTGGIDTLRALGERCGFSVFAVEPLRHEGRPISSTWIREALAAGDVQLAAALLGRPYGIAGTVVSGMQRGRQIGFPTANIVPPPGRAIPADGVYLIQAVLRGKGTGDRGQVPAGGDQATRTQFGVVNLGARPTFDEAERLLETHLLDFSGDLYGQEMEVRFLRQLRGIRRFAGVDELRDQIGRDIVLARELARSYQG